MSLFRGTILLGLCSLFLSSAAFAYENKTYECATADGLPKDTFAIQTLAVGNGAMAPFVEITRHFFKDSKHPEAGYTELHVKGFAALSSGPDEHEILSIAAVRLEFDSNVLYGCK